MGQEMAKKTVIKRKSGAKAAKKSAKKSAVRAAAKAQKKAFSEKPTKARPPKGPVWQWSALQTAAAIRSGAISSVEGRRGAHRAHARRQSEAQRGRRRSVGGSAEGGKSRGQALTRKTELGPLHGVPITIKENVDYEGRPNPNGVAAQMNIIAPSDAPVVRNLKKAGAIVLGLTNTPEFSFRGFTDNPLHGLTLNPWDPDITCGGSSGGAGAAVAPASAPSRTATTSAVRCAGRRIATVSSPSSRRRAASPPITRAPRPSGRCSRI
jgi:amidase